MCSDLSPRPNRRLRTKPRRPESGEQVALEECGHALEHEDLVLSAGEAVAFTFEGEVLDRPPKRAQALHQLV